MTLIRLEDVSITFRNTKSGEPIQALNEVNLTARDKQITAIIGPSGGGKSTLLRVISGDERKYRGDLFFDNRKMTAVKKRDRYVSRIFQNMAYYPHFKGINTIKYLLRQRDPADKDTEERLKITADILGLRTQDLIIRKQGKLSNTAELRLAIGRGIVRNPDVLLFDEPLANLDPQLRAQTRTDIKRLLQRFQITTLFVTHDQAEAMALGNQIAIMNQGHIEQVGTYRALFERPVNTFVAGFLGLPPMNLLIGGSVSDGAVQINQLTFPIPDTLKARVNAGQAITVGIRPEDVVLATDDQAPSDGVLLQGSVTLVDVDYARNSQLIHLQSGNFAFTIRTTPKETAQIGDTVRAILPHDKLMFFEGSDGQRIE